MGSRVHYESFVEIPELASVCLECTSEDCDGICDKYRNAYRAYIGLAPLPKRKMIMSQIVDGKRKNRRWICLEYEGEIHTLKEWARIKGVDYMTLYMRMKRGMSFERAIRL